MSDVRKETVGSISTRDLVETNIGSFEFTDGALSKAAVERAHDHLEFVHGVNVFLNSFGGASTQAIVEGFRSIGAEDNSVVDEGAHAGKCQQAAAFPGRIGRGVEESTPTLPTPISATDRAPNVFVLDAAGCGQPTKPRWPGSWPSSDAEVEVLRACLR